MVERLGEMRKRIEKGSREGMEKETKRQFEEKEGLRDPPLLEFLDPILSCSHCFFKSSGYDKLELKYQHLFFYKLIESILKNMSWFETECKTRRSVEHCTPHADGAWLNELGWSQ